MLALAGAGGAVVCGHKAGFALTVVVLSGALVWICLFVPYSVRTRATSHRRPRSAARKVHDRRAGVCGLLGFGIPIAAGIAVWQVPSFHGIWLHSGTAAFGAALVGLLFTAILASSMVDWYLILPWCFGMFSENSAIWEPVTERPAAAEDDTTQSGETTARPVATDGLDKDRRRRIAQVWVFHRGLCELVTLTCVAFLLAIGLVALGNALSKDKTLPTAFESLGGAGIAVGIFGGFLGPRLRGAMNFMLSGPVGLGVWVRGPDDFKKEVEGYTIDISIHPGIKLVQQSGERDFIPLSFAHKATQIEPPEDLGPDWQRETVAAHLARDPSKVGKPSFSLGRLKSWIQGLMKSEDLKL
jgi:hypothetical protein